MRHLALLALPLMLVACGEAPGEGEAGDAETEVAEALPATLDLQAGGIIVPPQNGFEQLDVPFGSNGDATQVTLGNILGEVTGSHDATGVCQLHSVQYEGMTLYFRDDEFVGYWAEEPFVPEMTRAEMLGDAGVTLMEDSTIENEFLIGDPDGPVIAGVFASAEDNAVVRALWAGENCIAR